MTDDVLARVQRAWNSVPTVPEMDWTEDEARQFMAALLPKPVNWREPSIEERPY